MFRSFMMACGGIVFVYTLLIIVRILSSWFSRPGWSRPSDSAAASVRVMRFLQRITDPYLLFFRRFKLLRNTLDKGRGACIVQAIH